MLSLSFIPEIEGRSSAGECLDGRADRQNYAYDAQSCLPVVQALSSNPTLDQLGPLIQKCYGKASPSLSAVSGTNLAGGTIPDSTDAVIIPDNSLDRILEINEEEMYAVV